MKERHRWPLVVAVAALWASGLTTASATGAPAYSVTLAATPTTLEVGETTTLTTTASEDLTGSRWITYVFDQTDPSWYRTCKVRSCSFAITQSAAGSHTYIAYIARERSDPRYPPMQIQATSNSVTVTWTSPTFNIGLAADRTWLRPGTAAVLTAESNREVGGRGLAIQIFDLTSGERVALCDSGTSCTALVSQPTPATHTYQAYVAAPGDTAPPPDVRASSNVVSVTWSVAPDPTQPPNIGGGPVEGSVTFTDSGVPPIGTTTCAPTTFRFEGISHSAWVNGSGTAYVGPLEISAQGTGCDTASSGAGDLAVTANGSSLLGSLSCASLHGQFTRVASDVTIVVAGDCTINEFEAFSVSFVAKGEFTPTNDGGGVTTPVTEASFAGGFTVFPN